MQPNGAEVSHKTLVEKAPPLIELDTSQDDWVYPYPTDFKIHEHPIDEIRELKVAVIGAGLAGIIAGALLPAKVPGINLTILEKNEDLVLWFPCSISACANMTKGGTWYENIYPGVRCDIPAHVYQSTFSPNPHWSEEYAQGAEIRNYWQNVAKKHDVYSKVRLQTKVLGAYWEPERSQWRVETKDLKSGEETKEHFDFLVPAIGHFNEWKLPNIPGIEDFQGHLRHSSNWDPTFDPKGKRIATIGNGASGIQITPELQKVASHVDHYARSRTWIAGAFSPDAKDRQSTPMYIAQEQLKSFSDPKVYLEYRKKLEGSFWRNFDAQLRDSDLSKTSAQKFRELMGKRLADKPELLDHIVPDFPPHCRRLTPGPGYLEALTKDNLTFIQTPISHFTKDGIVTVDGVHRPVDAIICSTGANVDFAPPFPIVAGEYDLSRDWRPEGKFGFPYTYMGVATPGLPNLLQLHGPQSYGSSGTVPHSVETQATYIAKVLRKVSSQGISSIVPRKSAADAFVEYCDAFFPRTNLSRKCSSWANGRRPGGRIHGLWPGSAAHLTNIRREPRWEDYDYAYVHNDNIFAYWGNGVTKKEFDPESDMTSYLRLPEETDLRDLHERWWDL
ncbi:FAD/NAD(P)-binding domain-containing protein [Aureobasidium pullulans]|nr:FAD/NAD(P)-binding domain-containing protein [Aureobasidium pullulans]THV90297.1 FAD/NAD(P)-binding domain-containing protein [Aureobasidium pullulans]